jgi:carbonic anhydrase
MKHLPELFEQNRAWADAQRERDPDFFTRLMGIQRPTYLWIGCSDSRVPANQIVGLPPGDLFVHRNVANLVVHSDLNCLSVLQFAVEVLGVKHVIVTGHYGCGGVNAALRGERHGLVDNWLRHVVDVREKYTETLSAIEDVAARRDRLCELNVIEQVANLGRTTIVGDAWSREQELVLHGWIYALEDGLLRDLGVSVSSAAELEAAVKEAARRSSPARV